jgi:hypothetical protein
VAATFGQPGTAGTILPNALQAGHNLVLALDHALAPGVQSGSRRLPGPFGPQIRTGRIHEPFLGQWIRRVPQARTACQPMAVAQRLVLLPRF